MITLFTAGIEASLQARNRPIITALDFHLLVQSLLMDGHWRGEPLKRLPRAWDQRRMSVMLSRLLERGALRIDRDFGHDVFRVLSVKDAGTAEEIACLVDPFCYVSYGSALRLHGLRGGHVAPLRLSTPEARLWKARRAEQVLALVADKDGLRPHYPRIHFDATLRCRSLVLHETTTPAPVVQLGHVRISTLGATFADTLAEPALCGGMAAVLKVWDRQSPGRRTARIAPA